MNYDKTTDFGDSTDREGDPRVPTTPLPDPRPYYDTRGLGSGIIVSFSDVSHLQEHDDDTRGLGSGIIVRAGVEWCGVGTLGSPFAGHYWWATIKALPTHSNRPRPYGLWGPHLGLMLHIIAIALLASLLLFICPLPASAHVPGTNTGSGRIFGQLLNGTNKNAPVVGQNVTLQIAQGGTGSDLTSITTDAQGAFSFKGLDTSKTINYAVYTNYEGAQYLTDLIDLSTKAVQQVNLTVYEATTSTANIAVVRATVLLQEPDAHRGVMTVSEIYAFKNLGTTTYVGSLSANRGKPNALLFSLPRNAGKVSLGSGFNGYQVIQVDPGFASNAAVPPGDSELDFSFQIPYTTSQYDFAYTVVYPTVQLSLFVPQDIHANSSGLNSVGLVSANKRPYHLFQGQVLAPGVQVHVELDGLPVSSSAANSSSSSSGLWIWIVIALLAMLAILGITWVIYRSTRRSVSTRQTRRREKGGAGARDNEKSIATKKDTNQTQERQQALLQELLDLDKSFEAGKIKKTEYQERRAKTKARLRTLMRTEIEEKASKGR